MVASSCPRSGVSEEACGLELADIFRAHGEIYRRQHRLSRPQLRAMQAIEICRTAVLGGHVYECESCGAQKIGYNSCRNRHCPKCQALDKARWLEERGRELLPVPYFHVVFTLPEELNALTLADPRRIYNLLFDSASQALLQLAADKKHLGAQIGFFAALHTWGQTLQLHPHLHCIVPGGGLSPDRKSWIASRPDFFLPVRALGELFRGKFLSGLKKAYAAGPLALPESLPDERSFQCLLDELYAKSWVVYSEPPFEGPEKAVDYLARYVYRVAISNSRLVRMENGKVSFTYKDYREGGAVKEMSLPVEEFIRRFLLHVLPERFVRVRYYGFLSPRRRERDLALCRELLGAESAPAAEEESWEALLTRLTGLDPTVTATCCGFGSCRRSATEDATGGPRHEAAGCANPHCRFVAACSAGGGVCRRWELRYSRRNEIAEEGARCRPSALPGSLLKTATPWYWGARGGSVGRAVLFPCGLNPHRATGSDWPAVSSNPGLQPEDLPPTVGSSGRSPGRSPVKPLYVCAKTSLALLAGCKSLPGKV